MQRASLNFYWQIDDEQCSEGVGRGEQAPDKYPITYASSAPVTPIGGKQGSNIRISLRESGARNLDAEAADGEKEPKLPVGHTSQFLTADKLQGFELDTDELIKELAADARPAASLSSVWWVRPALQSYLPPPSSLRHSARGRILPLQRRRRDL